MTISSPADASPSRSDQVRAICQRLVTAITRETTAIVGAEHGAAFARSAGSSADGPSPAVEQAAEQLDRSIVQYEAGLCERQDVVDASVAVLESWKKAARTYAAGSRRTEQAAVRQTR